MGIELFIFDWSGVISDDRNPVYEVAVKILKENGLSSMSFQEFFSQSKLTAYEFLKSQGLDINPQEAFLLYKKHLDEVIDAGIKPSIYPDVRETLDYLKEKDKPLAVLSSHPLDNLFKEAEEYGIKDYFGLIIGGARDKVKGLTRIVTEKFNVSPENALYAGDTIYDGRAARDAGLKFAAISGTEENQRGYHTKKQLESEPYDFILESLNELMDEKFF